MAAVGRSTTYAELTRLSLEAAQEWLKDHPDHIGAANAVREIERRLHAERRLMLLRIGAVRDGVTRMRRAGRAPTKRDLR